MPEPICGKKMCWFHNTTKGCRNKNKCKFRHKKISYFEYKKCIYYNTPRGCLNDNCGYKHDTYNYFKDVKSEEMDKGMSLHEDEEEEKNVQEKMDILFKVKSDGMDKDCFLYEDDEEEKIEEVLVKEVNGFGKIRPVYHPTQNYGIKTY